MMKRRTVLSTSVLATLPLISPLDVLAQGRKDTVTLAMTLEPPGLDPTAGAASAISAPTATTAAARSTSSSPKAAARPPPPIPAISNP